MALHTVTNNDHTAAIFEDKQSCCSKRDIYVAVGLLNNTINKDNLGKSLVLNFIKI